MPQKVRNTTPIKNQFDQNPYEFKSMPPDNEIGQSLQLIGYNQLPLFQITPLSLIAAMTYLTFIWVRLDVFQIYHTKMN